MPGLRVKNDKVPSLPSPKPKSPPDLHGKQRRDLAKVQILEREIGFLQEELNSIEGLQQASRSCKEVADFVTRNPDPLISTTKKTRRSCRFRKRLCGLSCFNVPWICDCYGCCPHRIEKPCCCFCACCDTKCFKEWRRNCICNCHTITTPKCPSCSNCFSSSSNSNCHKLSYTCSCCDKSCCCYTCCLC